MLVYTLVTLTPDIIGFCLECIGCLLLAVSPLVAGAQAS